MNQSWLKHTSSLSSCELTSSSFSFLFTSKLNITFLSLLDEDIVGAECCVLTLSIVCEEEFVVSVVSLSFSLSFSFSLSLSSFFFPTTAVAMIVGVLTFDFFRALEIF
jgi:hypothetical protein